jgi:hypothetical protein
MVIAITLAACNQESDSVPDRPAATADTGPAPPKDGDLLSLDDACARIWRLLMRHNRGPSGQAWEEFIAGSRMVLARSQPDVAKTLEPEIEAFEAARVEPDSGPHELLTEIHGSRSYPDSFAEACA